MTYALILDANYIFSVSLLYPTYPNLLFINLRLPFESMFTQAYDDEWESKYSVKRGFLAGSDVVAKSFVFFPKVQLLPSLNQDAVDATLDPMKDDVLIFDFSLWKWTYFEKQICILKFPFPWDYCLLHLAFKNIQTSLTELQKWP